VAGGGGGSGGAGAAGNNINSNLAALTSPAALPAHLLWLCCHLVEELVLRREENQKIV